MRIGFLLELLGLIDVDRISSVGLSKQHELTRAHADVPAQTDASFDKFSFSRELPTGTVTVRRLGAP
jgi:hypothetical protein